MTMIISDGTGLRSEVAEFERFPSLPPASFSGEPTPYILPVTAAFVLSLGLLKDSSRQRV
jgi:hypothetical protein